MPAVPLVALVGLRVLILLVGRVLELAVGAALDRLEPGLERALRRLLGIEVERGVDPVSRAVQVRSEPRVELLADELDEVFGRAAVVRAGGEQQRIGLPPLGLRRVEEPVVAQQVEHRVAALDAEVRILAGVVAGRGLGNRGQGGGFGDVQVPDRLAEVPLGRRLDAEGAVAQIDLVEIQLEDLVLGVLVLDLAGHLGLAQLPPERLVPPADVLGPDVPGQLHGDGREPLGDPHLEEVVLDRAEHPVPVDPLVLVEPLVLGGDEGRLDHRRHLAERHDRPPLLAQVGDEPAVGGVHLGGLIGIVLAQLGDGGAAVAGAGAVPGRHQDGESEGDRREE